MIRLGDGWFRLGPMVEANGFLMHRRLAAPDLSPPVTEGDDLAAGIPAPGLAMLIRPHANVEVYGQVAGMQAGRYGYFVGSDSGIRFRAVKLLLLTAGYRTFNLHIQSNPDFFRMNLRGPFVGLGFRF